MTSETTAESVPSRGNVLIEENLTPMQKLLIYLGFTGVLFLRSVSFCYQEADYADPDHPQHKHYNDAVINKRVNLAAAILIFIWYLYTTFFVEPFYHKYVTRRSQLRTADNRNDDTSPGQPERQQPSEEKTPQTADGLYDKLTQKTKSFLILDMKNDKIEFGVMIVDRQNVLFSNLPTPKPKPKHKQPQLHLPKKMTLDEYLEWRNRGIPNMEIKNFKES